MRLLLILFSLCLGWSAFAQNKVVAFQPWSIATQNKLDKSSTPQFILKSEVLRKKLIHTPSRNRFKNNPTKTIISFPLPNGEFQSFLIEEANNFHPDLAKKFPSIQAYAGIGIDDPNTSLRFSFSKNGLTGIIQSGEHGTILIDPIKSKKSNIHQVRFKKDLENKPFACEVKRMINANEIIQSNPRSNIVNCELRTYRFALACTGEYAQYHGGTKEEALIAMNNTLSVINGIFERDLAVTLELIPNTEELIYLDGGTDPYSNTELTEMLGENQSVCDTKIGAENYDLGHVFGTGLGGVAFLGIVCESNFKASGATGFPQPEGPIFAIDLVAHELGHQFGAEHTFNGDKVACAGSNRNNESAVEPGSGSTIMAYAGICSPQDVQANSDAYFHAVSLQQMNEVIINRACAKFSTNFENNEPNLAASPSLYHIPIATPFALTMNASDLGNSELTYTWEQMDAGLGAIPPIPGNEVGPMFRSIMPSNSPIRYFPNLLDLSKNISPTWEVLPNVERTMNFRGTVRDNENGGGCYEFKDVEVRVANGTPFKVTYPNNTENWQAGTEQTILWEVGNTTQSPISTQSVAILLSVDGGLTFPIILKSEVPNSGNCTIVVPNMTTSSARIMVRAEENIFFDLSNENFTITKPTNDYEVTISSNQSVCHPSPVNFEVSLGETGNFREPVNLKVEGLPNGVIAQFSNVAPVIPAVVSLTLTNIDNLIGVFDFDLIVSGSTGEKTRRLSLTLANSPPQVIQLITPSNTTSNLTVNPSFEWRKDPVAASYQLEIATDEFFREPVFIENNIEGTTFTYSKNLNNDTPYFWRIRGYNECGFGAYSEVFSFQTLNEKCLNIFPRDLPVNISTLFPATVSSVINIPDNGKLTSISINNLTISHTFITDLAIDLESPSGQRIKLIDAICLEQQDLSLSFLDDADIIYNDIPCPPNSTKPVQSLEKLNQLLGSEVNGNWRLIVRDKELLDGGSIENWELNICFEAVKPLAVAADKISVSCAGGNDGMASVSPNGGSGAYTFSWSNGATSSIIEGLFAGAYSVTIFDGNSSMDTTLLIEEPAPLEIVSLIVKDGCIGTNNGGVTLTANGGTPSYQYIWSNGATVPNLSALGTGIYKVTVTDNIGCQTVDSIQINATDPLSIEINSIVNPMCSNVETGRVLLSNPANVPTFYNWSNGLSGQNQFNLSVGMYSVYGLDVNGCEDTLTINIVQESDIIAPTVQLNPAVIYLDKNGRSLLTLDEVVESSFDACGAVDLSLDQTSFDCQKIGSQTVRVMAMDESGNERIEVTEVQVLDTIAPTLILNNPTIYLDENGVAFLNETLVDGGSYDNCSGIDIKLSQREFTCQDLGSQVVFVTGEDASNNKSLIPTLVTIKDTIAPFFVPKTPIIYLDETGNRQIDLGDIDGGSYDNCGGITLTLSSDLFDCQSIGNQTIELKAIDKNGNESIKTVDLIVMDTIAPIFECLTQINLIGCSNLTPVNYPKASDNCTSVSISIVQEGETGHLADDTFLSFKAVDQNDNQSFCYVPFKRENNFKLETISTAPLCVGNRGTATVIPIEGQAPYQYFWDDELSQTTATAQGLVSGTYQVIVIDNSGCVLTQNIEVAKVNPLEIINVELQAEINDGADGSISLDAIGGTGILTPFWYKADSLVGTTFNLTNLSTGTYTLNILDENGCQISQDFVIDFLTSDLEIQFLEALNIFPNPTNGEIIIDLALSEKKFVSIQVVDIMGRRVISSLEKEVKRGQQKLDLAHLENGLYFINFIFEGGVKSKKVLLTK